MIWVGVLGVSWVGDLVVSWSAGWVWSADYLVEYIWCWLLTGLGLCCIVGVVIIRGHD